MAIASIFYLFICLPILPFSKILAGLGLYIGLTPLLAIRLFLPGGYPLKFTWLFQCFEVLVLVFALSVLYSLIKLKNNPRLIKILYIAVVLSWVIAITNIFILLIIGLRTIPIPAFLYSIHPLISSLAFIIIAKSEDPLLNPRFYYKWFIKIISATVLMLSILGVTLFMLGTKFSWNTSESLDCLEKRNRGEWCSGFSSCDYRGIQIRSFGTEIILAPPMCAN